MTRRSALRGLAGLAAAPFLPSLRSQDRPVRLEIAGGVIEIAFESDQFDLPRPALLDWISASARAVAAYFGRFPVDRARLQVLLAPGRRGVSGGVTFGDGEARSRIRVGQHASVQDLQRDWMMTHEMVHYGFPSVDRRHHWIEEGSATYVEPIARAAAGALRAEQVWGDMVRDMPQGLPAAGDRGLDNTHTWGRTYWGGALFCLLADVGIREKTSARKGLVDALRAINRAGGNIRRDWPLARAFEIGDKACGGKVLMSLYEQMAEKPMEVDLADLWRQLGVERQGGQITFRNDAPLARVRSAISS